MDKALPIARRTLLEPPSAITEAPQPVKFVEIERNRPTVKRNQPSADWWRKEYWLVILLVLIGLVAHSLNMFNFPSIDFLDDEGIYTSQTWAVINLHHLAPYTYFYDHAPLGWMFAAGWVMLTGGFRTFGYGMTLDSGRVFMLVLHLAMIVFMYRVARKLGCNPTAAAFATLLFSLSPLAIFYQRILLLDNIMLFWILISLDLLLDSKGRLSRMILSGIVFGIAALSKETAIFLLPAMLYLVIQQRHKHHAAFGIGGWLVAAAIVISWYPLYAVFKNELFPPDQTYNFLFLNFNTGTNHVSLLQSLTWQATRDGGGMFNFNNQFWQLVRSDWVPRDAFLFIGGSIAVLVNFVHGLRDRRFLAISLLGLFPLYYFARGGIVLNYYILFAIPFLALNLAAAFMPLLNRLPTKINALLGVAAFVGLVGGYWLVGTSQPLYTQDPSVAGREAVTWIKQNIPSNSYIIMRDDLWTDLREPGFGGPAFPNIYSHWKVAGDPAVYQTVFKNDWHNVDYLIMSPGLKDVFASTGDTVALNALSHAHKIAGWSSEGNIVEVWKVDK